MSDLMNELLNNALGVNFQTKLISDFFNSFELEENKPLETDEHFLFKKNFKYDGEDIKIRIIIFKKLNVSYIIENNKITKVEKEDSNNDTLEYLIKILYREYGIGFDIITKTLFSEFLERFMKKVDTLKLKIKANNKYSAIDAHKARGDTIHTDVE